MEAKLNRMFDDQAVLRQMKSNYDSPEVKFMIDMLILQIQVEIEDLTNEYF